MDPIRKPPRTNVGREVSRSSHQLLKRMHGMSTFWDPLPKVTKEGRIGATMLLVLKRGRRSLSAFFTQEVFGAFISNFEVSWSLHSAMAAGELIQLIGRGLGQRWWGLGKQVFASQLVLLPSSYEWRIGCWGPISICKCKGQVGHQEPRFLLTWHWIETTVNIFDLHDLLVVAKQFGNW